MRSLVAVEQGGGHGHVTVASSAAVDTDDPRNELSTRERGHGARIQKGGHGNLDHLLLGQSQRSHRDACENNSGAAIHGRSFAWPLSGLCVAYVPSSPNLDWAFCP